MHRHVILRLAGALVVSLTILSCSQPAPERKSESAQTGKAARAENATAPDGTLEVAKLPNGLTVLVKRDARFPVAALRLYVHAGSAYETEAQAGISHLLEHMVFKGSDTLGPGDAAREIEAVGGQINAATSFDYTVYYVEMPSAQWKKGLDVISQMAFHAAIDPKELAPEKLVVLSELERRRDDPNSLLFEDIQATAWKGTPYHRPVIGYTDTVKNFTAQDIKDYIAQYYQPQSTLLVAVGDVEPSEIMAQAEAVLGGLENDRVVRAAEPFGPSSQTEPRFRMDTGKWNKCYLAAAFPIPGSEFEQSAALEVMAQVLGGDETSRLYRRFKYDKRLVDDISMSSLSLERGGLLYVHATLDPDKVEAFAQELAAWFASLPKAEYTDEELARAKLNLEDSLFLAKETIGGLAMKLGYFQFFEGRVAAEDNYLFSLGQTDKAELAELASRYVRADRLNLSLLAPEGTDLDEAKLASLFTSAFPPDAAKAKAAGEKAPKAEARTTALPGGSTLVLLPDSTLPYTGLTFSWTGGDGLLDASEQGLAELASRALTRGTARMSNTQIEDFLSDRAASISAGAGRETFRFEAKYPSRFAADLLGLVRDVLAEPAFAPQEVERAKENQVAAIRRREDQALGMAFRRIFPFMFASPPFDYLHEGVPEAVAGFTPEQVKKLWTGQRARPFVLAVCGDFDEERVTAFARDLAKELSNQDALAFATPKWGENKSEALSLPDRNQAHLIAAFPVPGRDQEDAAGLALLKTVLAGQSGLLFTELRDKQGIGYVVTSFLWQAPRVGFLAFYAGTEPERVEEAEQGFRKAIENLKATPLPQAELDRAKSLMAGEYYLDHQTLLSRSNQAAGLITRGMPLDADLELIKQAEKLQPQDLQTLAAKYLAWDQAYLLTVKP